MKSTKLNIRNDKGYKLQAYLEMPFNQKPNYYAIFAHCFTCNSSFSAVRNISRALTNQGFAVVRFDFTGLVGSEGNFAESYFSANVDDLIAGSDYLRQIAGTNIIGRSFIRWRSGYCSGFKIRPYKSNSYH